MNYFPPQGVYATFEGAEDVALEGVTAINGDLTTAGPTAMSGSTTFQAGGSTTFYQPIGRVSSASLVTTPVGNVGTGEDDLQTSLLKQASLAAAGDGYHITAWGTFANNANAKTLKMYFGSAVILTNSLTINVAGTWKIDAYVFCTGDNTQKSVAHLATFGAAAAAVNDVETASLTEDDGSDITVKCTGQATDDNDIVQIGMVIRYIG